MKNSRKLLRARPGYNSRLGFSLVALSLVAGCAVGPAYKRPEATTIPTSYAWAAASYAGATNGWKVAEPHGQLPKGNWWEIFGDPELRELENQAAAANQQLKAAFARFTEARALMDATRSRLFPDLSISASYTRQRSSANTPSRTTGNAFGSSSTFNDFSVPLSLGYELDLWGRVRRSVESARAQEQASADDLQAVKLAIQAELAVNLFRLRALDSESALLRSNIQVFSLPERTMASGSLVIPPDLPSELHERRPDISAAECRMAAANANIGVAKAAFFPTVRLNGLAGFESIDAGTLFNWPSRLWAVGPSITLPLFEGGRLRANVRFTQAAYEEMIANYRQTVLAAFADVEDNLAAQTLLASQYQTESEALTAARKQLEVANNRYRDGLITYLEVATAENTVLNIESTTVQLRGQQLMAAVTLVKALGGGWQETMKQ